MSMIDTLHAIFVKAGAGTDAAGFAYFVESSGYPLFIAAERFEAGLESQRKLNASIGVPLETVPTAREWVPLWVEHDPESFLRNGRDACLRLGYTLEEIRPMIHAALLAHPGRRSEMEFYGTA